MTWTPPEDAEVSNSNWTPPEDAVPVDSKKKESSVGSLTGSESITPLQSTSTSEIPTAQITDGEIDAAPLNRPSTMPYGVKMDDEGKITSDLHKTNIQKRAEALKNAAAKTFQDNPELFSDYQNRDAYFNRLLKYYKGDDYWKMKSELYKADPRFSEQNKKNEISNAITNAIDPTGGFATGAVEGAVEGVSHGAQQIAKSTEDFTRLSMAPAKSVGEIANAVTGELAGGTQLAMGVANLFVPELAAFTIGSKGAEEKSPGISNILAPVSYFVSKHYQDKGEEAPEWATNLGALGDLAIPFIAHFLGKKIAEKFKGKPVTPELVQEAIKETPPEELSAAIDKFSEDHGELFKQNDIAMEEANNLSSQAETLKADLEKAKGTPAEPIIAQKIEELNTKIDEIHNNEVEKQTAEAHTLSTLDHLQKQREQLVATKESLSPEGQKALEPEIKKVDDMIKEVEPKEEAGEVVPDNEVKEDVKEPVVEGLMNKVAERKPTDGHYGSGENVKFTDNVAVPFRYKLVEADQLQPSHLASGERNPNHQISLAQPKERNDAASKQAQDKIAANPNLAEVGENPNAYFGAPIVNKAGEVIQGNNRSIGLKKHYKQKGSSYKSQLAENAEKFGLTKDQVDGMENPVLVREVAVDDNTSVQLGNFDVKDLETGGKQRIDPIVTARKMTPENKSSLSSIVFDGDYKTVKEAIRSNVSKVAEIVKKYLNPAQFAKAFNKVGEITESGMDDIASVVNHFLFDKGDPVLPEAFSQIPDVIQKGLQKSLKYIMGTPEGKSILPETQNAVLAIYEWKQSGVADFNEWAAQTDMFKGVTPKDILSPLEFELAKKLSEAKTQADVSKVFAEYNDLVSDKPADMFNEATLGLSHNDAVKKQFKLSDYERTENKSEGHTETQGTEIPVDVTPKEVSGEKAEPAKGPEEIKENIPNNEAVEPTRQLGTRANVYFETDKYRVNDNLKNGKVLLNVGDAKGETPLRNIEFDTPEEAVFVAKKLQENAPNGLDSDFHNIDKIIENYKKEYRDSKLEASEPIAESKGVEEVNPDTGDFTKINDELISKTDAKENGTSSAEGSSKEGTIKEEPGSVRVRDDGQTKESGKDQVGDNNSTGIKNRIYDAERAAEGKPVIDTSTGKSKAESYEETVKKIDEGDITPEDIDSVREIAKSGKPNDKYSSEQVQHILIYDKVDLNNQYKKVSKEIVDNADSPSSVAQLQFQRAAIDAKMYDNYVASKKSGTEWSAAGRARQVEVNSDFTVSNLINDYKAAYPGKEIPETVRKQIEKLSSDLEDANKRIDEVLKSKDELKSEIDDIKSKLSESHSVSEINNPESSFNKRRVKRNATKEQARKLILDGKARLAEAAKAQRSNLSSNPFSGEMISAMKDIVEGHVIEKYTDFADLMDRAYQDVKEILPDITMKEMRDAVFEYGKKKTLNPEEHAKQMREIGRLGRLTSAYEDVVSGEAPKRSGLQRDVPTEAEKKIKREITNEMRKRGIEVDSKSPEDKWKTALESFKTRLKNEELALDQAKENGKLEELLKSKKREKTKLDEEAELLKERVGRKKKEARNIIKQRELEARPWLIKTLDEIKNMKKLFLVSGGSTLETLMGAAWWRAAFKIPNDIISYGLSNIPGLNKISKNALAENIGTRNDLAKSIASYYKVLLNKETYTKGAVEKFKTGSAKEEVLHGNEKDHILPSTKLLQAVQKWVQLHGAIKYPVFKAKFESAYETILANMIRKGENPESELVQEKAKGLALVEGLRDILNNDNDVVKAQRMIEGFAKNKGNEFAAITIGAQFPITKIASNYFSEMASTLPGGGLARSTPSLIKAIIKGGESLTPEQSDFVMRNLRQTTFGTGLALLGYYGYKQVSPFYGSVRKSTPAPDDNSIFGMNSHLTHNVGFEIMRFFATLHWKQDEAERLHKEGGTSEGLAAGAKGALLKNPYINQVTRLVTTFTGDDSSEKKIEKFVKEELKQTFVPPDIQKIAKYLEIPGFENFAKKKLKEEMDERASPTAHLTKEQKELNKSEMEAREEAKKLLCEQLGIPYVPPKSQQKKPHKSSLFRLFQ